MGGGLMQLVAYGAQDIYLTGNPQITFFKVVYRRHTNFSMEAIQQTFNGTVAANGRSTVTISRNGDLVCGMHVRVTRGGTARLNEGNGQFKNVILEIGGQQIDKHSGHWMEVWTELTKNTTDIMFGTSYQVATGTCEGLIETGATAATIGAGTAANAYSIDQPAARLPAAATIYTPLQFWFCRNPGLALPLIALQYHEVKVIFEWSATALTGQQLWVDYIYLDTDERRRFAQVSHEYLIEQVQSESGQAKASQDLNFNHPVKELIWTGAETVSNGQMKLAVIPGTAVGGGNNWHLKLNGHDRMAPQPGTYFTRFMPLQYHTGNAIIGDSIAVYSFALKPEEHQPSGTCNFSRIDNAQLVSSASTGVHGDGYIFAVNYNVLRIMSGMGGLAYSN